MLGGRTRGKTPLADFDQAAEPNPLAVLDVAEGAEDAGVGCAEVTVDLVGSEGRTGVEQLTCGPGGVTGLAEQKLLEMPHSGIIDIQRYHDFGTPAKYALKMWSD